MLFFKSLVKHWAGEIVAVLLTGVGRDGAAGLKCRGAIKTREDCAIKVRMMRETLRFYLRR